MTGDELMRCIIDSGGGRSSSAAAAAAAAAARTAAELGASVLSRPVTS